ncbi:MAG: hypothetical protein ACREDR_31555, partial [Blastocatellia bacterium]
MTSWAGKLGIKGGAASVGGIRFPGIRPQALISIALFLFSILAAWQAAQWISAGQTNILSFAGMGFVLCAIALTIL